MNKKNDIYFAKQQTVLGTPETTMASANFIEPTTDSSVNMIFENESVETCQATFASAPAIQGAARGEANLQFNLRSFGAAVKPDWVTMLESCGCTTADATVGATHKYTITQSTTSKDFTLWKFNGTECKKFGNMMGAWSISGDINKKCVLTVDAKGTLVSIPTTVTAPSFTVNGSATPAILPVTKTVFGSTTLYSPLKFSFTSNNVIEQRINGTGFGYGTSELTDRKIQFSVTLYSELVSVCDPYTSMRNNTVSELSFEFGGVTGRKIKLIGLYANIKDIKESAEGNIRTWEISGDMTANDFSIIVNSDAT